jgi:hypothetical protein
MNKTEQILAILQKGIYYSKDDVEVRKPLVELAKELNSLFDDMYEEEFVKWKDKEVGNPNRNGLYLYWEDHFTLDELFKFWEEEVKK